MGEREGTPRLLTLEEIARQMDGDQKRCYTLARDTLVRVELADFIAWRNAIRAHIKEDEERDAEARTQRAEARLLAGQVRAGEREGTPRLEPCPFCGKEPGCSTVSGPVTGGLTVRRTKCENCGAHGPAIYDEDERDGPDDAAKAWNRRAGARPSPALESEILDVARECVEEGWDGYGAAPVSHAAAMAALAFAKKLPNPSVSAHPDGTLAFEWYAGPRAVLSISVAEDGTLHYAALIGENRHHGTLAPKETP